ncbi:hypothetical protein IFM89_028923 [Coptis chinensis]|uniref:Uncharacterized protein n=1 Tax=Coptis chinensis TaxID=261450 RepID=A0A835LP09_9MAGN|nr:hypothetical protein IFM89_028923 [Coptis chinensis]
MSYLLPHLHSGWAVDQAILAEEERLVVIRFGHDWDETCMQMDEVLASVAETIKNFAVIYLVDITEVPDFNTMYELYDPSTVMFFFRNKHIMIDLGTGNNNKINWALKDKQEFIDIVETVYRGARKDKGISATPADAALMMQLGCDGVFVGSGVFKSGDPARSARVIVQAVTHYSDPDILAEVSCGLGEAMVGLNLKDEGVERFAHRSE